MLCCKESGLAWNGQDACSEVLRLEEVVDSVVGLISRAIPDLHQETGFLECILLKAVHESRALSWHCTWSEKVRHQSPTLANSYTE